MNDLLFQYYAQSQSTKQYMLKRIEIMYKVTGRTRIVVKYNIFLKTDVSSLSRGVRYISQQVEFYKSNKYVVV